MADNQKFDPESNIKELIRNIVHQGGDSTASADAEWEGCLLFFRSTTISRIMHQSSNIGSIFSDLNSMHAITTRITMSDGTCLYDLQEAMKGTKLNVFRHGPWVERLTAYSKQLTEERFKQERDEEKRLLAEKKKPFQSIDF